MVEFEFGELYFHQITTEIGMMIGEREHRLREKKKP